MVNQNISMLSPAIGPREFVYKDKVRQIDRVVADFGSFEKEYFVIESGRRAGLLVVRDGSALLVRQYRLLLGGLSWEIPGGRVEENESPEAAAIRECFEETGVQCQNPTRLIDFQPGLDSLHNPTHLFYATELIVENNIDPDPAEVVEHHWVPLDGCVEMVFSNQIADSFSMVAILAYMRLKEDS